jgi:transcriptional regulator with XRE-family HTH domain
MRILTWRAQAGMSQEALADATGLTHSTISRIERGTHWPCVESILRIWKATKGEVKAQDIFDQCVEAQMEGRKNGKKKNTGTKAAHGNRGVSAKGASA